MEHYAYPRTRFWNRAGWGFVAFSGFLLALFGGCHLSNEAAQGWLIPVPRHFPTPVVPTNNPMTPEKVKLGRYLFYDTRLSGNGTQSCSSCHLQAQAFTDGLAVPKGSTGDTIPRNSMALINVAYNSVYTWANPALGTLEQQIVVPLFAEFPVELGVTGKEEVVLDRLRKHTLYPTLFAAAFPGIKEPISMAAIIDGLASFVRSLVSSDAPYDRYVAGDKTALTDQALQGMELFFSERLECHHCHGGFNFSFTTRSTKSSFVEKAYHNTGLYNLGGTGAFPAHDTGLHEVTGQKSDIGKFRPPTLRNIEVTAPYMHDGSIQTLEEVVRFYEAGGRNIEKGPYVGDGRLHPNKSGFVQGFTLTDAERAALIAFLTSLTDKTFLTNPAHSNPWQ